MGHPCIEMVDNTTDFESKIRLVIEVVCKGLEKRGVQLEVGDRLQAQSKKRKFLIKSLPDFQVCYTVYYFVHMYIQWSLNVNYRGLY